MMKKESLVLPLEEISRRTFLQWIMFWWCFGGVFVLFVCFVTMESSVVCIVKTAPRESESNNTKLKESYSHKYYPVSRLNVFKRFAIRLIILGVHLARFACAQQEGYADTLCTS